MASTPSYIKKYAREDFAEAVEKVNRRTRANIEVVDIKFETYEDDTVLEGESDYTAGLTTNAVATLQSDSGDARVYIEYFVANGDDVVYVNSSNDELAKEIAAEFGSVRASTALDGRSVMAADELSGDEFDDQLDNMAGSLEDMQDTLEEVTEDDASIEIDNNITDHYIAECDRCHGIFISAMIESDQDVESITGVCPLCGKESEQYLKWIVRDVGEQTEEVEVELADEFKPHEETQQ